MGLKYLSLFSGIEAATVAWEPLGWEPLAFAEIEPFPCAVLKHHYPNVPNLGDVTKADYSGLKPDLVVFGSPCQSFSVAGKRLGMDDPRGNLALYALGVVDKLRPSWFLFENVPGLLSSGKRLDFGAFLEEVGKIGYLGAWRILDAQYFGVPQRRRRLFFVGHLGDWRCPAAVLFERESLSGNPPPGREAGEGTAPAAPLGAHGGSGYRQDLDNETYVPGISHALNAGAMGRKDYETETFVTHSLKAEGHDAPEDGTGRGTPLIAFSSNRQGQDAGEMCPTLRKGGQGGRNEPAIAFTQNQSGDVLSGPCAPSMGTNQNATGRNTPKVMTPMSVRRLTPLECSRLQGFPDGYLDIMYRGKPAADGPKYKALGNSMAVPVISWLGRRIQMAHELKV